jgi:hypothetical protein
MGLFQSIRMSSKKRNGEIVIVADDPVLPGTISTAKSRCGKPNCACKARPPRLDDTYYRWTGSIQGSGQPRDQQRDGRRVREEDQEPSRSPDQLAKPMRNCSDGSIMYSRLYKRVKEEGRMLIQTEFLLIRASSDAFDQAQRLNSRTG